MREITLDNNKKTGNFTPLQGAFLEDGFSSFNEAQIIEFFLGFVSPNISAKPIAKRLLKAFGSLKRVIDAPIDDLCEIDGINEKSAILFKSLASISQYYNKQNTSEVIKITNQVEAKKFCESILLGLLEEEFLVVCLNANGNVIGTKRLAKGTDSSVPVPIRALTDYTLKNNCEKIIIAHNHPNSSPEPSVNDIATTVKIIASCIFNDINVVDHIICSPLGSYSFMEHSIMDNAKVNAFRILKYSETCATYKKFCANDSKYVII